MKREGNMNGRRTRLSSVLCPLLCAAVGAGSLTPNTLTAADNIDSLVNASFQTSWTYRSGGAPSAPAGWTLAGWGATAGGPQYYTGAELSSGRVSDHRCKWEFAGSGAGTNNVIAKEVNWGTCTQATITVYCAGRTWGGTNGDMKLGVDADGNGTQWTHCSTSVTRTSNDQTWTQLSRVVNKPGGATTFTVMLNAVPGSTTWNCQFDALTITGSNPCTPPPTPGAPTVNGATCATLNVANSADDSGTAYFAFCINGGGYANQYIQANGSVGPTAVWQTRATWGTRTVTGLASATQYTFTVKAANDASGACPTGFGPGSSGNTTAVPAAPTGGWGDANATNEITWSWNLSSGTGNVYRVYDAAVGGNLKATSATDATWVSEAGLAANTPYSRWVATYKLCQSSRLELPVTYTLANVPLAPTVNGATSSTLNVTVNENSNPATTTFAIKCVHDGNVQYVQADGTLDTGEVFQTDAGWGTKTVTGLASGTTYTLSVCAKNGGNIITAYGPTTDGTTTSGCGGDNPGSLTNADFQTTWTYRSGGAPSAPSGWSMGDWGATSGGPQQVTTGNDCAGGRPTDHRCKFEIAGSGAGTENMIRKEVLWGGYSQATVTAWCAQHAWSGGSGTQSLGVKDNGCGNLWSQRTHTANNTGGECSWNQVSLVVDRPGAANSFTVMLNGHPNGTNWNCQFDGVQVTMSGGLGTVTGNVKDGSGANVSGATVSTDSGGYTTATDANGNYTLSNVAVGSYNVTASKTGYNPQTQNNRTVTAGQTTTVNFTITLQSGNGTITGRLRDVHMAAISGATVTTTPSSSSTTTAADGSFTLSNIPVNTYSVNFAKTGYQTGIWYNVVVATGQQTALPDKLLPRSGSKIGAHVVIGNRTGWGAFLQQTHTCGKGCQMVKCMDDFGACYDATLYSPETLRVGRSNEWCGYDMQGMDYAVGNDPAQYAQIVYDCVSTTTWQANPHIEVWEIFNEWSAHWAWQADFLIAMMDIAEPNGRRIALFGCSGGNPPEDAWPDIARACARAKAHGGHVLSLHEYAWNDTLQAEHALYGDATVLRYRRLYDYLRTNNADCPLVLTEVGNNGGGGYIGDAAFVADMSWYDDQCRQDDYVLGIASWTLGEWSGANWYTALPEMGDYICSH